MVPPVHSAVLQLSNSATASCSIARRGRGLIDVDAISSRITPRYLPHNNSYISIHLSLKESSLYLSSSMSLSLSLTKVLLFERTVILKTELIISIEALQTAHMNATGGWVAHFHHINSIWNSFNATVGLHSHSIHS